jgi:Cdc6-like AAA superfamily ATPase
VRKHDGNSSDPKKAAARVSGGRSYRRAAGGYAAAVDFIEGDDREMVIAGAAGTGKTTVIAHVVKALVR